MTLRAGLSAQVKGAAHLTVTFSPRALLFPRSLSLPQRAARRRLLRRLLWLLVLLLLLPPPLPLARPRSFSSPSFLLRSLSD